jgi:uncharacterized membrane protein (UPF0127 family)
MALGFLWGVQAFASGAIVLDVDPSPLIIRTENSAISYDVEVADTEVERAAGLMFRQDFPQNRAMLFDFEETRAVSMWMKNTPLPLDMLFVDDTGLIAGVAENTTPHALEVISSPQPVAYVVELNAGQVAANRIKTGDRVLHPAIKPALKP